MKYAKSPMNTQENKNKDNENSEGIPQQNLPTSQRISVNNLPIRQLLKGTEKEVIQSQIGKAIALVLADIGLKTIPDQLAQKRMIHYLLTYYQDLSFEEIVKAFELALVGRFDVNIEHYDSFDIKYLTQILNAYRKYRKGLNQRMNSSKQIGEHQPTEEENRVSRIDFFRQIEKSYQVYEKTGNFNILMPWFVYDKLLNYNVLQVSENEWNTYQEQAEKSYKQLLQTPKSLNQRREFQTILQNFDTTKFTYPFELYRIRNIAKENALRDFFEKLKNSKTEFNEILLKSDIYE